MTAHPQPNRKTVRNLVLVALAMFGFGYALSPLYDVLCQVTGIGGKTGRTDAQTVAVAPVDRSRTVTVEFTGNAVTGLPWEFRSLTKKLDVHPGETTVVKYLVRNLTDESISGQAIPSVTPFQSAAHFKKLECFCFTQQTLKPGETREMPVQFVVEAGLDKDVHTITLSYAFFNTDKKSAHKYGGSEVPAAPAHEHHAHGPATANGG
jgi:cytochrome c oxidase assembly protein subunit 11